MALRDMVEIDEAKCDGCGLCVQGCPEGALQVAGGKARLVGDLLCDGLGACIGACPRDALRIFKREAEPYDERLVMENVIAGGAEVIKAHIQHLLAHQQWDYFETAALVLKEKGLPLPAVQAKRGGGCPGSAARSQPFKKVSSGSNAAEAPSALAQWPVQLRLIMPASPHFAQADALLAADCTAFALGSFHARLLQGRRLAIACPKLDDTEGYVEKLVSLIDEARINSLTVAIMEVPCCFGLLAMAQEALARAQRKIELHSVTIGVNGGILAL